MTVKDVERLYDYDSWATRKILAAVAKLTPEQFTQAVAGSYGSVRNTLVHVTSAKWGWVERCGGAIRGAALKPDDFPSVESVIETWTKVESHVRALLSALKDEDLTRTIEFSFPGGETRALPLGELLQHGTTHGVHHRGQIALLLRSLGHSPGNFDVLIYDIERRAAR